MVEERKPNYELLNQYYRSTSAFRNLYQHYSAIKSLIFNDFVQDLNYIVGNILMDKPQSFQNYRPDGNLKQILKSFK
jgi:hypothetical protein